MVERKSLENALSEVLASGNSLLATLASQEDWKAINSMIDHIERKLSKAKDTRKVRL